jgi:hypothetical protein
MVQQFIKAGHTPERALELAGVYELLTKGYDFDLYNEDRYRRDGLQLCERLQD